MAHYQIAYAWDREEVAVTQLLSDAAEWQEVCRLALELVAEESGRDVRELQAFSVLKADL